MSASPPFPALEAVETYRLDDLHIDLRTRRVLRGGLDLQVPGLSFDLLIALMRAAPALVSSQQLLEQVWPGLVVGPETLTQRVKLLRQALGDSAENPRYVVSTRGHGYRIPLVPIPMGAAPPHAPADVMKQPPSPLRQRRLLLALGVPVLVAGSAAAWWWRGSPADGNREAHRHYLAAEAIVDGTPASFQAAIALYSQALDLDPRLAPALSGRALNRAALVWSGFTLEGLEEARSDARRALSLDPKDGRALAVLGSLDALQGRWIAAEASFRAAIDTDPANADVRARYALSLLLPTGQVRKAVAEAAEAQRLAPGSPFTATMLAFARQAQGADEEAVRMADLALTRGGDSRQVAPIYAAYAARHGRYAEAAERALHAMPPEIRDAGGEVALRQAFAALDDPALRPQALAGLRRLTRETAWQKVQPRGQQIVRYLNAELGALDDLYSEMDRLLDASARVPQMIAIASMWSLQMRGFRQHARFQPLVDRLGMIEYWRKAGPPDGCTLTDRTLSCG